MSVTQGDVQELTKQVEHLQRQLRGRNGEVNTNTNNIRVDGLGGVALGLASGAAIACAIWVGWVLGDLRDDQCQDDAFIQAAYQYAPQLRDEYNRIKAEQEKPRE